MSLPSLAILRQRDFRLLLIAQLCITMALQAQAVIVGWQVYTLTKDPFLLGLIGLTEAVPAIISALFAGHFVDVGRPHRIYLTCISLLVINTLVLFLIGGHIIEPPIGSLLPWLFGAVFVSGLARSFTMPASFALLGHMIPREKMPAASAWRSTVIQFSSVAGPAVAGLVYGGYGVTIAWSIPVCLLLIATLMLATMRRELHLFRQPKRAEGTIESIKAGWRFILTTPVLLAVMALDMFAVLFGGAVAVLPAFADQILATGSEGLGLLRASPAIGAIATALFLAIRPLPTMRPAMLLAVVAGFGMCMIGFGLSTSFIMAMTFLILSGIFDSVSVVMRSTIAQWLTPDHMRGRVSAVNSMFIISSNEIGAFESGLAARYMGLVPSIVFGGAMTLLVVIVTTFIHPPLRHMVIDPHKKPHG